MRRIQTSVKSVEETISVCLQNQLTFAAYRLPNRERPELIVQKDVETAVVENLSDITALNGFLVAPFLPSEKNRMFIIHPDFYFDGEIQEEQFEEISRIKYSEEKLAEPSLPYEVSKEEYLEQIQKITGAIKNNEVQKVVLSRVKVVNHDSENQIAEIFSKLCKRFANAFIYVFKVQGRLWMGATPEPFAFLENNVFHTSSVAGTKENIKKYQFLENWGSKEKQEQRYVSDYIDSVLNANHWENITQNGPYVKKAGNLLHLRTDFTSNAGSMNGNLGHLIYNLHPTPAVCGFPKDKALEIIRSLEKHDREYYSGFLGPVGMKKPITLFVNLRCMKIIGSQMVLYSGGGLTIDSHPVDEWYETEIKTGTLLSVIYDSK
ncbi:MAG: chorismate-binding protein [Prolixibacteraceae bacterium]|nr:chorismate-binding protein [Prolixibacteraceae bacterium]